MLNLLLLFNITYEKKNIYTLSIINLFLCIHVHACLSYGGKTITRLAHIGKCDHVCASETLCGLETTTTTSLEKSFYRILTNYVMENYFSTLAFVSPNFVRDMTLRSKKSINQ